MNRRNLILAAACAAALAAGNAAAAGAIAVGAAKVTATAAATVATAATPATVLPSFWTGLFFDPLTGQSGIGAGLTNMFNGAVALGKSFGAVVGAVFDPSITVKEALKTPLSLSAPV